MDDNKITVLICHGTACVSAGSPLIKEAINTEIKNLGIGNVMLKLLNVRIIPN